MVRECNAKRGTLSENDGNGNESRHGHNCCPKATENTEDNKEWTDLSFNSSRRDTEAVRDGGTEKYPYKTDKSPNNDRAPTFTRSGESSIMTGPLIVL